MGNGTIRVRLNGNYTTVQNKLLWHKSLSWMAKATMIAMLSRPPDWDYSVYGLAVIMELSRGSVGKYLAELEAAGYLKRCQSHSEDGKFGKARYILTDVPGEFGDADETEAETADEESPLTKICATAEQTEAPLTKLPSPVKPSTVIWSQDNIRINKILDKESIPPIAPQTDEALPQPALSAAPSEREPAPRAKKRRSRGEPRETPRWKPERFEGLWKFYPAEGRKDKQGAMDEWDRLSPSDELIDTIALALIRQKASEEWRRGIGIPYLCRYLRRRRWEDEAPEAEDGSGGWAPDTEVIP